MDCYLKMLQKMVTRINHVIARPDLHYEGPLAFWKFSQVFLPNIGEDQKVSLSERRATGWSVPYYGKYGPSYCIAFIQRSDECLK